MEEEETRVCEICEELKPAYEVRECDACTKFACNSCTYQKNGLDLCSNCFDRIEGYKN